MIGLLWVLVVIGVLSVYCNSGLRAHASVEDDIVRLIVEKNKVDIDRVAQDPYTTDFLMKSHSLEKAESWTDAQGGSKSEDYMEYYS